MKIKRKFKQCVFLFYISQEISFCASGNIHTLFLGGFKIIQSNNFITVIYRTSIVVLKYVGSIMYCNTMNAT